jgi:RimJ/RimL family protein N-acetyltransferase
MSSIGGPSIVFNRIDETTAAFVYECLEELRGSVSYPLDMFISYLREYQLFEEGPFQILVAMKRGEKVGMLTCNRFSIPRYLGFGIEIEEIVTHPSFQGQGIGSEMLKAFLSSCAQDPNIRTVIVKTDDPKRAGLLYSKSFNISDKTVYSKVINRL